MRQDTIKKQVPKLSRILASSACVHLDINDSDFEAAITHIQLPFSKIMHITTGAASKVTSLYLVLATSQDIVETLIKIGFSIFGEIFLA